MMKFACITLLLVSAEMSDETDWQWSDEKASILYYFMQNPENYGVKLIRSSQESKNWPVHVVVTSKSGVPIWTWESHHKGAFVFSGSILVYSLHSPDSCGCTLVGYDLEKKEQRWKSGLKAAGSVPHSKYRNQINLSVEGKLVTVFGSESNGQYIETVELATGKTVSHSLGKAKERGRKRKGTQRTQLIN